MKNYCQRESASCSSCCGVNNIEKNEREEWLLENTRIFLATDISRADNIAQYRKHREKKISYRKIDLSTYVCPFTGYIDLEKKRTGCLLHPQGSPHPQIKLWEHPQNFSFYGESICMGYNCRSKENDLLGNYAVEKEYYPVLVANHNLLNCCRKISTNFSIPLEKLLNISTAYFNRYSYPVTSFEFPLKELDQENENLFELLGCLLEPSSYGRDHIVLTRRGRRRGRLIQKVLA